MKNFVCANCKIVEKLSTEVKDNHNLILARAYTDEKGINHFFVYCRQCRTINDVIGRGCILGLLSMPFGMAPYQKHGLIDLENMLKNDPESLKELPPNIKEAIKIDRTTE